MKNNMKAWIGFINETPKGRKTGRRPVENNTYVSFKCDDLGGTVNIRLHNTDIITFLAHCDAYIINSGGWQTVTTKARLNKYMPDATVWSEKGIWYVGYYDKTYNFQDGMMLTPPSLSVPDVLGDVIEREAQVTGATERDFDEEKRKLQRIKQINKYAKEWARKLMSGEMEAPNGGDCWMCYMTRVDGEPTFSGVEHLINHMEEKYYVPSLLTLAMTFPNSAAMMSIHTKGCVHAMWHGDKKVWAADLAVQQISKCISRYMRKQFGFSI